MSKLKTKNTGKPGLGKIFQEFNEGEHVAIVKEPSVRAIFPSRLQGFTGTIIGKRGKSYIVEIKTGDKRKKFIVESVHLKKIK
jgi:large subunit ribosomal protein L21e